MASTASLRRVVPLTSARASTARGTQDLVPAAQAAMDKAVNRLASYADSSVPALSVLFGGFDPFNLGGMATLSTWMIRVCCYCVCVCIFCRYRRSQYVIMGTRIDPVGSPIECGGNTQEARRVRTLLVRYGPADNPCERGETAQHICGCCLRYWECVRTHWCRAYSSSVEREYEHGHVRKCYCQAQVVRLWRGDCRRYCFRAASL